MDPFHDKVAIVTGGASGIGRAVCLALGARRASVTVADRDEPGAEAVAAAIRAGGGVARAARLDVSDAAAVQALVDETAAREGRLDLMFNNAGIAIFGEERSVSLEDWRRVLDVNLFGVLHGVRAAYPLMVRQGSGHIVNTASLAGLFPYGGQISYTTSKFAVVGLSHALRAEGAGLGVRVSVVCPGVIDTPMKQSFEVRGGLARDLVLRIAPRGLAAERCAGAILKGVARNRATIVITAHARLAWWLHRISPALGMRLSRAIVEYVRRRTEVPSRGAHSPHDDPRG